MWLWVQSIWIFAERRISVTRSSLSSRALFTVPQAASDVISRITSSVCRMINISYWQRFYGETLLEETRRAGVNVSNCIRLHGHSTATYLLDANKQEETILAINDTHILQQLTPQLLNTSRDLIRHAFRCWLIVISHLKPWSGSLPLLMKFRCLSIRFRI